MTHFRSIPRIASCRTLGAVAFTAGVLFAGGFALAGTMTRGVAHASSSKSNQGYLGVDIRDVSDDQAAQLKAQGQQRGAEVIGMDHDGPACKSGMLVHDIILQMNGQAVEGGDQLRRMLRDAPAGKQVTFLLSRDGQQRTISAQMANREVVEREAWENHYTVPEPDSSPAFVPRRGNSFLHGDSSSSGSGIFKEHSFLGSSMIVSSAYTGAKLEVMGPQLAEFFGTQGSAGLLVREVAANSPAADAGFKAGDVVVRVNQQQVVNGSDWSKTIHENRGKQVNVVILREKKEQTLTLIPDAKKRSSLEHGKGSKDLEKFFGNSDEAMQTRLTLAELVPLFDAMTAGMQQRLEEASSTPQAAQMLARLEMWSANPDFRRQIEIAQQQVRAAAVAAQGQASTPELEARVDRLRLEMRGMIRLD
ncbi:MAG: PDZ domain-containing protein [Edaphobacter sp.]|uniref:PDZ domain-containing protein n=1 Tax=Edaphobacter sp. TaxID=1934404 RepID=UPI002387E31F|nr:PDZ domain-containing protein [Edaphobacter sp.]MDE1178516.1 PDZ domain-containing protein [Edaphobacter sp.]